MNVARKSPLSGKINVMDLNITESQWERYCTGTEYIQDVFPDLTPSEREFIKTGYTEEDWNNIFGPNEG